MSSRYSALGIHVFAGGFTYGVQQHFDVLAQLEPHQFGTATASKNWGVVVDESPSSSWEASYSGMKFPLIYGNPRCTAFSSLTGGCDASTHGPFARQCADINEFMTFALGKGDILIWESVQQAYSVGKPLVDHWVKQCEDFQYRVAHVFINAATFGNAQQRKRYFFVAYKNHLKFNVDVPEIEDAYATVWDVISHLRDRECYPMNSRDLDYTRDSFKLFKPDLVEAIPLIATGMCLNSAVAHAYADMPERLREKWDSRTSNLPFSLHSPRRLGWMRPCPTLTSSSWNFLHPWHHRPLTVGELSCLMGWGDHIPVGPLPIAQISKGVVPAVGAWIARQAALALDEHWGNDEWSSTYNEKNGFFEGSDSSGLQEKTIDLTGYCGHEFHYDSFPEECRAQQHRFNVDQRTGKLIRPWNEVRRRTKFR